MKLYSFKATPLINGLKVNCEFWIYYDAATGTLAELRKFSSYNYVQPTYSVDTTIKISPEDGLKNLKLSDKENYTYSKTIVIEVDKKEKK